MQQNYQREASEQHMELQLQKFWNLDLQPLPILRRWVEVTAIQFCWTTMSILLSIQSTKEPALWAVFKTKTKKLVAPSKLHIFRLGEGATLLFDSIQGSHHELRRFQLHNSSLMPWKIHSRSFQDPQYAKVDISKEDINIKAIRSLVGSKKARFPQDHFLYFHSRLRT